MPGDDGVRDLVAELSAFPSTTGPVVDRLVESDPSLAGELVSQRRFGRAVIGLVDLSRSITASLLADPSLLDAVRAGVQLPREQDVEAVRERWSETAGGADELRRFKRRELVRVAARDVSGIADLPATGRELAALADVVMTAALELAEPEVPMAIVGMGKLGGNELNYASDVDLIVVHDGDPQAAARTVRRFVRVMSEPSPAGTVWRTDLDLRPEGPAGALSRTPASYGAYYRQWAQPWEYQALIKTRYVAGDVDLSNRFFDEIRPVVWGDLLPEGALDHIRRLKERVEERASASARQDVKRMPGGIRDVEFAVQILQLVHGRNDPSVRSPSTLEALEQLERAGHLGREDADRLDESYCYLRTVEHRLQLRDERQTHELPTDREGLVWLARVLGHRQPDDDEAVAAFRARHERRLGAVREIHGRLFHRRTLEPVAATRPIARDERVDRLREAGFADPAGSAEILERLTGGVGPTSRLLAHLVPLLIQALGSSADPDLALRRLSWIADGPMRGPAVASAMRESPVLLERLCRLLGASGAATAVLRQNVDAVSLLDDPVVLEPDPERVDRYADLLAGGPEALAPLMRHDVLQVMIADVLDGAPVRQVGSALAGIAEDVLAAALAVAGAPPRFAVVALGRLGGRELSYSSDLDVIFLADTEGSGGTAAAEAATVAARQVISLVHDPVAGGRLWEVDVRLRPEGESAPILTTLAGAERYYARRAMPWELQAMLRLRHVAGDAEVTGRLATLLEPLVYRAEPDPSLEEEVRKMKRRIERERAPADERRLRHLKLGPGGLVDVEFTVQLLQLRHGGRDPSVRTPSTFEAIERLEASGHLSASDASVLAEAYELGSRLRDRLYLERGRARDELPAEPGDLDVVARTMGHSDGSELAARWTEVTARCREVVERVFYEGRTGHSGG